MVQNRQVNIVSYSTILCQWELYIFHYFRILETFNLCQQLRTDFFFFFT